MPDEQSPAPEAQDTTSPEASAALQDLLQAAGNRCPFGPRFFVLHLGSLIRRGCPDPAAARPVVEAHLLDGEVLDVCHVIGLAPDYVALAVYAAPARSTSRPMRTELVPYAGIARVSIAVADAAGHEAGFDVLHRPFVVPAGARGDPAEALMRWVASPPGLTDARSE